MDEHEEAAKRRESLDALRAEGMKYGEGIRQFTDQFSAYWDGVQKGAGATDVFGLPQKVEATPPAPKKGGDWLTLLLSTAITVIIVALAVVMVKLAVHL